MLKLEVNIFHDIKDKYSIFIVDSLGKCIDIDISKEKAEEIAEKLDLILEKIPF